MSTKSNNQILYIKKYAYRKNELWHVFKYTDFYPKYWPNILPNFPKKVNITDQNYFYWPNCQHWNCESLFEIFVRIVKYFEIFFRIVKYFLFFGIVWYRFFLSFGIIHTIIMLHFLEYATEFILHCDADGSKLWNLGKQVISHIYLLGHLALHILSVI